MTELTPNSKPTMLYRGKFKSWFQLAELYGTTTGTLKDLLRNNVSDELQQFIDENKRLLSPKLIAEVKTQLGEW